MNPRRSIWELTPYEVSRHPQPIPDDDQAHIKVTPRFLEAELSCAICLDILRNTRTTKECLHRFCDECISQALRSGNKECPNCRAHLASMRSLRPDPLFDAIIGTIFPNRADLDRQQSQLLAHLAKTSNRSAMLSSIEEGKRHQAERRGARGARGPRKIRENHSALSLSTTASEAGSVREASEGTEVEMSQVVGLEIVPYKKQLKGQGAHIAKKWKRRYVKVKGCATVAHLSRFIISRLMVERQSFTSTVDPESLDITKLSIYAKAERNEFRLLEPNFTLTDIQKMHSRQRPYVTLAFSITGTLQLS